MYVAICINQDGDLIKVSCADYEDLVSEIDDCGYDVIEILDL